MILKIFWKLYVFIISSCLNIKKLAQNKRDIWSLREVLIPLQPLKVFRNCWVIKSYRAKFPDIFHSQKFFHTKFLKLLIHGNYSAENLKVLRNFVVAKISLVKIPRKIFCQVEDDVNREKEIILNELKLIKNTSKIRQNFQGISLVQYKVLPSRTGYSHYG